MPNLTAVYGAGKRGDREARRALRYTSTAVKQAVVEGNLDATLVGLAKAVRGDGLPPCALCHRDGRAEPWAIRAVLECAGAVGVKHDVALLIFQQLGAKDEREVRNALEITQRAQQYSKRELVRESVRLIQELVREDGALAAELEPLKALSSATVERE